MIHAGGNNYSDQPEKLGGGGAHGRIAHYQVRLRVGFRLE